MQRQFSPRSSNSTPDSLGIRFNRLVPTIGFRQGLLDLSFGYATYPLGGRSRTHIFLGATASQDVPISGKRPHALFLPVLVSIDFTKAEGSGTEKDNFNIASVGVGFGLKYRYTRDGFDLIVQAAEAIHFSTEGTGTGSGYSGATIGEALLVFRDMGVFDGIIAGYRFRYQMWGMNSTRFNYTSTAHGPFVGVVF
jgi:hypothetical protein